MLEDVTREIEEESNYLDYIPRRNDKLEPLDLEVLGFSNFISMSEDQYSALAKGISYINVICPRAKPLRLAGKYHDVMLIT